MKRFMFVAGLAALAGCGLSEDKFSEQSIKATCEWIVECFNDPEVYADVDACITELTDAGEDPADDCTYDAKKAKECLDGLEALTCDSDPLTDIPEACGEVYDCPEDTSDTAN